MFKNLLKELENLKQVGEASISIEADEKGYLDKECPSPECLYKFKVHREDWSEKVDDDEVHCPKCGHIAPSKSWWTTEQIEAAKERVIQHVRGRINQAMREDAKDFNRRQPQNSFIKMTMTVEGPSKTYILPIPALDELEQKIACSMCKTRYAVIGSAFFCPCCGHNSAEETFSNTINIIESSIRNLPIIKKAVSQVNTDEAENTCRALLEKGLSDCVVAFQRFCEVTYRNHHNAKKKIPFNAFQKLDVGGNLWKDLIDVSYSDWLSDIEIKRLTIFFQRRHLLQHTEGMVDYQYIEKTGDSTYKENQRIVVNESDVIELVNYIRTIVEQIKQRL